MPFLIMGLLLAGAGPVTTGEPAQGDGPLVPPVEAIDSAVTFILEHMDAQGCISGSAGTTAWAAMAIVAAGHDPHGPGPHGASLVDGLKACEPGRMVFGEELTAIQRHLLAVVAVGGDPTSFNERDWEQEVRNAATTQGFFDPLNPNSLNNDMFGILSLMAAGATPTDSAVKNAADRLVDHQNRDGGWGHSTSLVGNTSDTDMTAAALQALLRAQRIDAEDAVARDALTYLESRIRDTDGSDYPGCFSPRDDIPNPDTDSTAWGVLSLLAVHQDPRAEPWGTHGGPWGCLKGLQKENGGFPAAPGASAAPWPTTYAVIALTGSPFSTIKPDMERPEATITTSGTHHVHEEVTLRAQEVAFAGWLHENGTHWQGTTVTWTPHKEGVHRFSLLLLDENGLAASLDHPVLVLPEPSPDDPPIHENDTHPEETELFPWDITLQAPDTAIVGQEIQIHVSYHPQERGQAIRIDWGDGSLSQWIEQDTAAHAYAQAGDYTITAWARTVDGVLSQPIQAKIQVHEAEGPTGGAPPTLLEELPGPVLIPLLVITLILFHHGRHKSREGP